MTKRKRLSEYPGFHLGGLTCFNARYEGSKVAIHFDGAVGGESDWIAGTVVALREQTLRVKFGTGKKGWTIDIDPNAVYGVLLYRPIRVGSDFQADI